MEDQAQGVPVPPLPAGPVVPQAPQALQVPQVPQGQPFVHLNCSNFKPEFLGKPDEDAEAHLLHTNNSMDTHHFIDGVKVQRFSLTLLCEAWLWYQSLEPKNVDWQGTQNLFRQQYSKIGNTREQLFHK